MSRSRAFLFVQVTGWLFLAYLVYAQGITALDYDFGVAMGTQEPVENISEIGKAFWYGFAVGDAVFYIPLLFAGLIGLGKGRLWGKSLMVAAMGITIYWPIVCLVAVASAHGATGWVLPDESAYWVVLPAITVWAAWVLWWLVRAGDELA